MLLINNYLVMKKLFLSVAAMLCVTLMFSQGNINDIKQDGTANDADIVQAGLENDSSTDQTGTSNFIDVNQNGRWQEVDGFQDGTANEAKVKQGINGSDYNTAFFNQIGNNNKSDQFQVRTDNYGSVRQYGDYNVAEQDQDAPTGGVPGNGNTAYIKQGSAFSLNAFYNDAKQDQVGNRNYGEIEQWDTEHVARQVQDGNDNSAVVKQDNQGNAGNDSYQRQYGDHNTAWGRQNWLTDYSGSADNSGSNFIDQNQNGNSNSAYVSQDRKAYGEFATTAGLLNYSLMSVVSTMSKGNEAYQDQDGDSHRAYSHQSGLENKTLQNQDGIGSFSFMQQDGEQNDAIDNQDGLLHRSGVYQKGDVNISLVDQTGAYQDSKVSQMGEENNVSITQQN